MDISRIARGGTPITLDKPRLLLFDMAATWLLIQKYKDGYLQQLYGVEWAAQEETPAKEKAKDAKRPFTFVLHSMDALQYYLWVGLQADCRVRGEELALERAGEFITPFTYPRIFNAIIAALDRNLFTPAREGDEVKTAAETGLPPSKTKPRTSSKQNASRAARSAGRGKSSGPPR